MILTCPECATSYFVDDDRIPAAGRSVKCSSCGNRWRAMPEGEAEAEFEPAPSPAPVETLEPEDEAPGAAGDDDIEFVPAPVKAGRKPPAKAREKGGSRGLVVGVVLLGVLAAAGGAAAVFREQVAGMVPGSAAVFAAIGLPVSDVGLSFEGVTWKPTFLAGRPVMAVTGAIRNTTKKSVEASGVRVSLLSKAKADLATYELTVTNARIPPGGLRYFAYNLQDPPAGVDKLAIAFNTGAGHLDVGRAEAGHAAAAPVEAQPLPSDSPDALPHHE
jgi:predicted Zn finger-like uncharacterized protein